MFRFKHKLFFYLVLFFTAFVFVANDEHNSRAQTKDDEEFNQTVRDALAEIKLPTTSNQNEINAVAENLSAFIEYRSGVRLSPANKNLLRDSNKNPGINRKELIRDI